MGFDVTYPGAVLAGLVSFASPCILPIVPPYLCFLAGVSLDELTEEGETAPGARRRIVLAALFFALGFATVFIALGLTASTVGQLLSQYYDELRWIAGGLILVFGLHFLGILRIPLLYREARIDVEKRPATFLGAYLVGLAFAFGWTPCVGPVLASILAVAGGMGDPVQGGLLLGAYALGIGVPFVAAAFFAGPFMRLMRRFRRYMGWVEKGMGAALVVTGLLFITNAVNTIAQWMLNYVPTMG
jgi:cytochrome c-type biogenesis protein